MVGRFRGRSKIEGRFPWPGLHRWLSGPRAVYLGVAAALVISFYLGEKPADVNNVESSKKGLGLSGSVESGAGYHFAGEEKESTGRQGQSEVGNFGGALGYGDGASADSGKFVGDARNSELFNTQTPRVAGETEEKQNEVVGYFDASDVKSAKKDSAATRGDFNLNASKIALEKPLVDEQKKVLALENKSAPSTDKNHASAWDENWIPDKAGQAKPGGGSGPAGKPADDSAASEQIHRKLVRNAGIGLEVKNYASALRDLTDLAQNEKGFVATQDDRTQANGHTAGRIVVKLPPDRLDEFVMKLRELGAIRSQVLKTDDVTKAYFDTEARLHNARKTEERLLELMAKKTDKVADLLQVEKEIGRVRESIEEMQGELKLWDSLASLATVTIDLVEQDMDQAAAYLLKERANLSIYSADVDKSYKEAREQAEKAEAQIVSAQVNRSAEGQANATLSLLVAPDRAFGLIEQLKTLGRVQSFDQNTERVAQDGRSGIAGTTRRDKVEVQVSIVHDDASRKTVALQVVTPDVEKALDRCKKAALAVSGEILTSNLQRNPNGHSQAILTVRLPSKRVEETQAIFAGQGRVGRLSVQRNDQTGANIENEDSSPVILALTLADEEPAVQLTRLEVQGEKVAARVEELKTLAKGSGIEIRASSFSRSPDGVERSNMVFRLQQKEYSSLLNALQGTGKTLSLTLERRDRVDSIAEAGNDPVEVVFSLKSLSPIVANQNGFTGAIRQTLSRSFSLLFKSGERIVTGLAYLLPWLVIGSGVVLIWRRVRRRK